VATAHVPQRIAAFGAASQFPVLFLGVDSAGCARPAKQQFPAVNGLLRGLGFAMLAFLLQKV